MENKKTDAGVVNKRGWFLGVEKCGRDSVWGWLSPLCKTYADAHTKFTRQLSYHYQLALSADQTNSGKQKLRATNADKGRLKKDRSHILLVGVRAKKKTTEFSQQFRFGVEVTDIKDLGENFSYVEFDYLNENCKWHAGPYNSILFLGVFTY